MHEQPISRKPARSLKRRLEVKPEPTQSELSFHEDKRQSSTKPSISRPADPTRPSSSDDFDGIEDVEVVLDHVATTQLPGDEPLSESEDSPNAGSPHHSHSYSVVSELDNDTRHEDAGGSEGHAGPAQYVDMGTQSSVDGVQTMSDFKGDYDEEEDGRVEHYDDWQGPDMLTQQAVEKDWTDQADLEEVSFEAALANCPPEPQERQSRPHNDHSPAEYTEDESYMSGSEGRSYDENEQSVPAPPRVRLQTSQEHLGQQYRAYAAAQRSIRQPIAPMNEERDEYENFDCGDEGKFDDCEHALTSGLIDDRQYQQHQDHQPSPFSETLDQESFDINNDYRSERTQQQVEYEPSASPSPTRYRADAPSQVRGHQVKRERVVSPYPVDDRAQSAPRRAYDSRYTKRESTFSPEANAYPVRKPYPDFYNDEQYAITHERPLAYWQADQEEGGQLSHAGFRFRQHGSNNAEYDSGKAPRAQREYRHRPGQSVPAKRRKRASRAPLSHQSSQAHAQRAFITPCTLVYRATDHL